MSARLHPAMTFAGLRSAHAQMTPHEFFAYMALLLAADGKTGLTPPISYAQLAHRCRMGTTTAKEAIKKLREARFVKTPASPKPSTANAYALTWGVAPNTSEQQNQEDRQGGRLATNPDEDCTPDDQPLGATRPEGVREASSGWSPDDPIKNKDSFKDNDKDSDQDETRADETPTADPGTDPVVIVVDPAPSPKTIFEIHADEFGELTAMVGDVLRDMIETYGEAEVREAQRKAVLQGKRSLAYVAGILKNREREGKQPAKAAASAFDRADTGPLPPVNDPAEWLFDGRRDDPPPADVPDTLMVSPGQRLWDEMANMPPLSPLKSLLNRCKVAGWDGATLRVTTQIDRIAMVLNGPQAGIIAFGLEQVYGQPVDFVVEIVAPMATVGVTSIGDRNLTPVEDKPFFQVAAVGS